MSENSTTTPTQEEIRSALDWAMDAASDAPDEVNAAQLLKALRFLEILHRDTPAERSREAFTNGLGVGARMHRNDLQELLKAAHAIGWSRAGKMVERIESMLQELGE
jgi:hypothetical protein